MVKVLTFEPSVAKELMINGEPFGHHNNKEITRFSLFFSRGSLVPLFRLGVRSQSPDNPTPFIIPSSTVSKSKEAPQYVLNEYVMLNRSVLDKLSDNNFPFHINSNQPPTLSLRLKPQP